MSSDDRTGVIELTRPDRRYLPGQVVEGTARWSLRKNPSRITVRLAFRITRTGEQRVLPRGIAELAYLDPTACGECQFRFRLPAEPYSFSGKLFTITWAVDLRLTHRRGDRRLAATLLTMSPTGDPR